MREKFLFGAGGVRALISHSFRARAQLLPRGRGFRFVRSDWLNAVERLNSDWLDVSAVS